MTTTAHWALLPRDGFFCKDGRGWQTSTSNRGHGLEWPWPSTILGACRAAFGRREEARRGSVLGRDEWRTHTASLHLGRALVIRRPLGAAWRDEHRVWPVPADARWLEGQDEVERLEPAPAVAPTLGRDDDLARETLMAPVLAPGTKPLPSPRWWSDADFTAWLMGQRVPVRDGSSALSLERRRQVHVKLDVGTLTADEGQLFSHDVMETIEPEAEWGAGVEVILPESARPDLITLGSDGRLTRTEALPAALFAPPERLLSAFRRQSHGLRLVVVSPTSFERGWLPDGLEARDGIYRGALSGLDAEVLLRAAIVPRPLDVSGWDMAAGRPKPATRMVAPGSVYFFERADRQPFTDADANALWLAAVGARADEGFGRVVPGLWTPMKGAPSP